jgi:hypothetical protein
LFNSTLAMLARRPRDATSHFPPLAGVVVDERPSSSAGCIDDEVKPVAIGVVAGLGDRFELAR